MHYRKLVAGVKAYYGEEEASDEFPKTPYEEETIGSRLYSELVADKRSRNKLVDDIEYLLLDWNRRVPVDVTKLRLAVKIVPDKVKKWDLAEMNLWDHHEEITKIFGLFVNTAKPRKGKSIKNYTGASKALHILNPRFFMMWEIRCGYGCCECEEGYFNFLLRSQREIKEAISTYNRDHPKCPEISLQIYEEPPKSILKLLDEYNIAKYTKEWI
jgi:hypothetical protein